MHSSDGAEGVLEDKGDRLVEGWDGTSVESSERGGSHGGEHGEGEPVRGRGGKGSVSA